MNKIKNSLWIISEKLISILGLIFVTSYVAKYTGPSIFGVISLSMVVFQFVQSVSMMGVDVTLLKRISEKENSGIKLLFSAFILISIIYLIVSFIIFVFFEYKLDYTGKVFLIASAAACYFSSVDLVNIYNEAMIKAKVNVICNVIGLVVSLTFRYIITHQQMNVELLAIPIISTTLIPFLLKVIYFKVTVKCNFKLKRKELIKYSKFTFSSGLSIIYSIIAVGVYTRLNQFSITYFLGVSDAGIFAIALTLSNAWLFVPNALLSSFYPSFFSEKNHEKTKEKFTFLNLVTLLVSIPIIVIITLLSPLAINILYGKAYLPATTPLVILSFAAMFGVMSSLSDRYMIKSSGQKYIIKKSTCVMIFCAISSLLLVPNFGLEGGAWSVLLTEFASCTFMNYFFSDSLIFRCQKKILNIPYSFNLLKRNFSKRY